MRLRHDAVEGSVIAELDYQTRPAEGYLVADAPEGVPFGIVAPAAPGQATLLEVVPPAGASPGADDFYAFTFQTPLAGISEVEPNADWSTSSFIATIGQEPGVRIINITGLLPAEDIDWWSTGVEGQYWRCAASRWGDDGVDLFEHAGEVSADPRPMSLGVDCGLERAPGAESLIVIYSGYMGRRPSPQSRLAKLLVAVVALAALGAVWWQSGPWRDGRRARASFSALSVCLTGGPITRLARPAQHLRATQIAASLDSSHSSWPSRCEPYASRLRRSVGSLLARQQQQVGAASCGADPRCSQLVELLSELTHLEQFVRTLRLGAFDPARLGELGQQLSLSGASADSVVAPPPPATLLEPPGMTALYRGNYLRLLSDPAGDDVLDLLFYEHQRRYGLCSLDLRRSAEAHCRILPSAIPVGLAGELLAAERGPPTLLYARGPTPDGWSAGLYGVDSGQRVAGAAGLPAGGFVWQDGAFAWLSVDAAASEVQLMRHAVVGDEQSERAPIGEGISLAPRLVWDEIVWTALAGQQRHRLYAQRILSRDEPFAAIAELGTTPPLPAPIELDGCRTAEALVLLVTGKRGDGPTGAVMVFRTSAGWQAPLALRVGSGRFGFTCQQQLATLSWVSGIEEYLPPAAVAADEPEQPAVRGQYEVHRLRCGPASCHDDAVRLEASRHSHASRFVAGDLGEAMVLLWRSTLGDVRMRLAPLEQLPRTPAVPLFDDLEHDGFGWDLEREPIYGRAGAVLVLLSAPTDKEGESAIYGLRIDAEGRVSPVGVAR